MAYPSRQGGVFMSEGRCSNCGRITSHFISSDGVLCASCHSSFKRDEDRVYERNQSDRAETDSRISNRIESEYYTEYQFDQRNYYSEGRYRHPCSRYKHHTFWSNKEYASGLCDSCSKDIDKIEQEANEIWKKYKVRFFARMRQLYKSYGLDFDYWDEKKAEESSLWEWRKERKWAGTPKLRHGVNMV